MSDPSSDVRHANGRVMNGYITPQDAPVAPGASMALQDRLQRSEPRRLTPGNGNRRRKPRKWSEMVENGRKWPKLAAEATARDRGGDLFQYGVS